MPYRIKNWAEFQHYKDRCPPWIKLYRTLLEDINFLKICGDSEIGILIRLWLIASEDKEGKGQLPDSETLAVRLHMAIPGHVTKRDISKLENRLSSLNHWLVQDASTVLQSPVQDASTVLQSLVQDAIPETETETERETEQSRDTRRRATIKRSLPNDWEPNAHHKEIAIERGLNLADQVERFKDWAIAKATKYADWDRGFNNWLKNSRDGRVPSTNRTQQSVDASLRILRQEMNHENR